MPQFSWRTLLDHIAGPNPAVATFFKRVFHFNLLNQDDIMESYQKK